MGFAEVPDGSLHGTGCLRHGQTPRANHDQDRQAKIAGQASVEVELPAGVAPPHVRAVNNDSVASGRDLCVLHQQKRQQFVLASRSDICLGDVQRHTATAPGTPKFIESSHHGNDGVLRRFSRIGKWPEKTQPSRPSMERISKSQRDQRLTGTRRHGSDINTLDHVPPLHAATG